VADPTRISQQGVRADADRRADAELSRQVTEATAGGGLVRAQVDGYGTLRALEIAPEAFEGRDPDLLADLVMSAITEAQRRLSDHG
jgi:hypothetical protein